MAVLGIYQSTGWEHQLKDSCKIAAKCARCNQLGLLWDHRIEREGWNWPTGDCIEIKQMGFWKTPLLLCANYFIYNVDRTDSNINCETNVGVPQPAWQSDITCTSEQLSSVPQLL